MNQSAATGGTGSRTGAIGDPQKGTPVARSVELDIAALRQFADEIMDEYNNYIKPQAEAIIPLLTGEGGDTTHSRIGPGGADPAQTLGAAGGEYAGKALGGIHADNANAGIQFVTSLADGLHAAALGTAVYAEALEGTDLDNASELSLADSQAAVDWTETNNQGQQEQATQDREVDR